MKSPLPVANADRARYAAQIMQQGQMKQAERILKDVLRAEPGQYDALVAYGVLCGVQSRLAEAAKHLQHAVRRKPDGVDGLYNFGQALIRLGKPAEAIEPLQRAAGLAQRHHIHEKLGDCLAGTGKLDEAVHQYATAVVLAGPQVTTMLLSSLIETKRRICDWKGLDLLEPRLIERVAGGEPAEPLLMHYVSDDPAIHRRNAQSYWHNFLKPMIAPSLPARAYTHQPHARERIRIGYLSSDFRRHATAHLIAELIERHDRQRFEIVALSFGPDDGSPVRRRLETAFDRFIDLRQQSSADIARRIHALGIDILVDLNGYIASSRPEILAARAAPVQCHYLAFPGTLGTDVVDYMIVDPVVAPQGAEQHFTEALVRLPDSYQANDRTRPLADGGHTRARWGLPETGVVLCSFNNAIKLTPAMFDVWMRVLAAVPDSVLWMFADNTWVPDNLAAEAEARGIAPTRLVMAGYVSPAEHLARLRLADLFLDTQPYGAHTTASDALWEGVPVLTIAGRAFAGRVGASLLTAAGLPELIMPSLEAYEQRAIELGRDPGQLAALKQRIAAQRDTCRLFDTDRFTRHLEAAYVEMWQRHTRGDRPQAFDVPALA